MTKPLERRTVYEVIDGEREYQKRVWGKGQDDISEFDKPVESFLLYMRVYLNKAMSHIATENGCRGALHELRKVLALGVACAEQHGLPERKPLEIATATNRRK